MPDVTEDRERVDHARRAAQAEYEGVIAHWHERLTEYQRDARTFERDATKLRKAVIQLDRASRDIG